MIKLAILEEVVDDIGVNAAEDVVGKASHRFFPFVLSPLLGTTSFPFSCSALPTISASSNSSNGLTGNR
jgi:hypothetical protein